MLQQDRRAGGQRAGAAQQPDRIRAFACEVQRAGELDGVGLDRALCQHLTRAGQDVHAQGAAVGPSHAAGARDL